MQTIVWGWRCSPRALVVQMTSPRMRRQLLRSGKPQLKGPLGLPKLSNEQIAIIRGWIVGGAQAN